MSTEFQNQNYREIELKLRRFLDAQTAVFQGHQLLTEWCRESLNGAHDQTNYDVAKVVFKDIVAFESQFEEFEIEFWNYLTNTDDTRRVIDHLVDTLGFGDHKEYFFSKIENCVTILNDVITEVNALELEWPFLQELEDSLEKLFDVSEDLIEINIEQLRDGELAELLRQIPAQRLAPLEVVATPHSIKRKIGTRFQSRINDGDIRQAFVALKNVLADTYLEIENSNCDPRIAKAFSRCLAELSRGMEAFSPIQFGIYVGIANGFRDAVSEELGTFLSRQVIAAMLQCDIFLRNFEAWEQYSREATGLKDGDSAAVLDDFLTIADDPLFDIDVRDALSDLKVDKQDFGDAGKLDYAVFQSISNALSEVCRQGLRYISSAPRKAASLLGEVVGDGFKFTVGVVALTWVVNHSGLLISLSEKYGFFAWIKPVVEFIKLHAGA